MFCGALVERARRAVGPTRTPTSGSSGPRTTGSTGSPAATSPTIRGAATCSAARSRSRGSRTRRPARSSRPRRRRCPRRPAASATGTTATPGSATRRSRCGASTRLGFDWEANDFFYFIADVAEGEQASCRSCTASTARPSCRSARSTTSRATRARSPCASATPPTSSASTTSGARCSTRSTCTRSPATSLPERIWPILVQAGRGGARALARARPRHLGGARRAEALHVVEGHVLGRRRPRRAPRRAPRATWRYAARWQAAADEIHADICANAVDERGVFSQHYDTTRSTRRCC